MMLQTKLPENKQLQLMQLIKLQNMQLKSCGCTCILAGEIGQMFGGLVGDSSIIDVNAYAALVSQ